MVGKEVQIFQAAQGQLSVCSHKRRSFTLITFVNSAILAISVADDKPESACQVFIISRSVASNSGKYGYNSRLSKSHLV
mgnify:FL=1